MTEILNLLQVNAETGEETIRPLNEDELIEVEASKAESLARKSEAEAKAAARENALAKLAALGLSKEEIDAL
jgi:Mn-dependent DtxR family transcriptional regulator